MKICNLSEVAIVAAGQGAPQGEKNYSTQGIPFIKAGNLVELLEGKSEGNIQKVTNEVAKSHRLKLYPKGTVLFAKSGMSCMKGYVYVTKNPAYVVSHLACITPFALESDYLKHYFNFYKPNTLVKDEAYPSISLADISTLKIKVFDDEKRKKIINELELLQILIKKRKEELVELDNLVKSQFIEMFGDPMTNPKGYELVPLSDMGVYFNGLTYKPENVVDEGMVVLRSSNIQEGTLDFADIVRVDIVPKEKLLVRDGDILMCSRNGSAKLVGKVALIKDLQEPMTFGAFMMIIRANNPEYLLNYFRTAAFREQIKTGATTTINQITSSMLDKVRLPKPSLSEMECFARFTQQTDKSKFRIKESLENLENCYKALLQKYFG